jgi:hypothetical protein
MSKIFCVCSTLVLLVSSIASAQVPTQTVSQSSQSTKRTFDLQIDPTPFFFRGFAPEAGVSIGRHRIMATVIQYDVPTFLLEDAAFSERRDAIFGLAYQFFFFRHLDGLFAGIGTSATRSTFTRVGTASTRSTWTWRSTLRVGWMVSPFASNPHVFFAPWLGVHVALDPETFALEGRTIERRTFGLTGAIQIGYRFAL